MFPWAILFWCSAAASVIWAGIVFANIQISEIYHPMSVRGDLLHPLRLAAAFAPLIIAACLLTLRIRYCRLKPRIYSFGVSLLAIFAVLPLLPSVNNNYRQVYWLDDIKHEIPWQYAPHNGSSEPGGKYFLIKVSASNLVPAYETSIRTITIGKALGFNYGEGDAVPDEICSLKPYGQECQWRRGDFVYSARGDNDLFPSDISNFTNSVTDLLNELEASSP
ncbi:hypothetical protein ABLO27_18550 [Roseibium sp. SCPC15]|uniref:hypothetical protein n=1 Tax=Roseibium sp. SCP15 TaxID=3141376 RepID=UPI0033358EFC